MRGNLKRFMMLFLFGFGLLGSGCAHLGPWPVATGTVDDDCTASQVISDSRRIVRLPPAEQRLQVQRLRSSYDKLGGDRERFVLACLALFPESLYRDHNRALQLLQGYRRSAEPRQDLLALAELLEALVLHQQQLERALSAEKERGESLAGKLKALETIERIIQERERKALPTP